MEGFSIACTTCRTRLRVRDVRILGQILPCPKCGSMVLIERPSPSGANAGFAASSAAADELSPAPRPQPRSDSFENIDRLLEEPLRLPAAASDHRWRTVESQADADETSPREAASQFESASVGDWMEGRAATVRSYLLLGGGALAGVSLAFGLAGWVLSRSTQPTPPTEARTSSEAAGLSPPAIASSALEPAESPAERPTEDDTSHGSEAAVESSSDRSPPPSTTADIEDDSLMTDDDRLAAVDAPVDAEPTAEPLDQQASPPDAAAVEALDSPSPPADDDLAAFAQWLQDPDAALVTSGPPIPDVVPSATEPAEEIQPDEPSMIQPTRSPPIPVDVVARLDESISALQLKDIALNDALRFVTQLSTIPIHLDPDALGRRNLRADRTVNLTVRETTMRGLLDAILEKTGLTWAAREGHVVITTEAESREEWVTIRHDVSDLTHGDATATAALAEWIVQLIEYGTWPGQTDVEAEASCNVEESTLVITHHDTVHYEVLEFCEKLRGARGLPPRTRILKDRIGMGAARLACGALDQSVSLRLWRDQSINDIAAELGKQASLQILVDWPALYEVGWSPQDMEQLFCEQQTLREVLTTWLRPKGLTYRVIDRQTIEITTPTALADDNDVEFYPVARAAGDVAEILALGQKILAQLGEAAFQPQGTGAVAFDKTSGTLIVSLPQPEQLMVARIIGE